jgi:hypothetical protein
LAPILKTSFGFFAHTVPTILLASFPVLYLGHANIAAGILATFVLMRTLSGLPRAILQQFGMVLGQECGRRIAINDSAGSLRIVKEGARFYSVISGVATGLLFGAGLELTSLWTGNSAYFQLDYLLAAVLPGVLGAFAVLGLNILAGTNAPFFAAVGRWVQLVLTVVCVLALPIDDLGLRMLVALSIGEVLGFAPLAYYGVGRLVPGTTTGFHLKENLVAIVTAVLASGITRGALGLVAATAAAGPAVGIALAVVLNAILVLWIGVRSTTRQAFLHEFVSARVTRA